MHLSISDPGKSFPQDAMMLKGKLVKHKEEKSRESLNTLNHVLLRTFPKLKIAKRAFGGHILVLFSYFILSAYSSWKKECWVRWTFYSGLV